MGVETIKALRAESQFQNQWEQFVRHNALTTEKLKSISAVGTNFTALVQKLVTVFVVIVGVYLFVEGEISPGAIIASVILAGRAVAPLGQIAGTLGKSQQAFQSYRVLNQIMLIPGENADLEKHIDSYLTTGSVEFEKLGFTYPEAERPALRDFSLKIKPGERVGIIGRIGSGKTTLGRLIGRLYVPTEGSLLLDGVDIRQYHPSNVRRRVAFVSQDSVLFHGSVRDNIVLGAPYVSDDLVLRAADLSGVSEFVNLHPKGFDMPVGEGGRFLSAGQRQLISLARAFLFDPLIVFLDEPSGSMDMASERALIERLKTAFRPDQTVILTTHRTAMLALVTRLVVIENGTVVADGPRDAVLKKLRAKAGEKNLGSIAGNPIKNVVTPDKTSGPAINIADAKSQPSVPDDGKNSIGTTKGKRNLSGTSTKKTHSGETGQSVPKSKVKDKAAAP